VKHKAEKEIALEITKLVDCRAERVEPDEKHCVAILLFFCGPHDREME
jgi:hypothetical protein